jgi:RHS repeat-associated protein
MGQRLVRSGVVAASCAAVVAGLLAGGVAPATAVPPVSADEVTPLLAEGELAGIDTIGPIATVTGGGSVTPPRPVQVATLPAGSVLAGADVRIYSRELRDVPSIPVRLIDAIATAGDPNPNAMWSGRLDAGWGRIDARLTAGRTYIAQAQGPQGWAPIGTITARSVRDAGGPQTSVGSLSVSQVLGTVSWGWTSRELVGPGGGLAVNLGYAPGQDLPGDLAGVQGLPAGWSLGVETGSPWRAIATTARTTNTVRAPRVTSAQAPAAGAAAASVGRTVRVALDVAALDQAEEFAVRTQATDGTWSTARTVNAGDVVQDGAMDVDVAEGARAIQIGALADGQLIWGDRVRLDGSIVRAERDVRRPAGSTPGDSLPAAVRLLGWDGSVLAFRRNDAGAYEQVTGGAPGFDNSLTRQADGDWVFTDIQGVSTTFTQGRVSKVAVDGQGIASVRWDAQGRVTKVIGQTDRAIDLVYAGEPSCQSSAWTSSGFAAVPAGMLCQIRYPGQLATDIGYVGGTPGGAQIGLVKDPGNRGTALGWDSSGRLVSSRSSLVARSAVADPDVRAALPDLVDRVEYDGQGRAARLISHPGEIGGVPVVRTVTFPAITEPVVRAFIADPDADKAVATSVGLAPGQAASVRLTSRIDPITWRVLESKDAANLTARLNTDPRTGAVESTRSPQGLVTRVETNDLGLPTTVTGPFAGAGGMQTQTSYDSAQVRGKDTPIYGWRVAIRQPGRDGAEFWPARASSGLSAQWRNVGDDWAATASAVWTPSAGEKDVDRQDWIGWAFRVSTSGGTRSQFVVAGMPCSPDQMGVCTITGLPKGPKSVLMRIDRAPASGVFDIEVAPVTRTASGELVTGRFDAAPQGDVAPGFNNVTRVEVNDTFRGSEQQPATTHVFDDPASGRPSEVDYVGGLTERFRYEDGGWGRLISRITPGGERTLTSYWEMSGTATTPAVCGSDQVPQQGLTRSVTRQDGSVVTYFQDVHGRLVASEVRDAEGSVLETGCQAFRDDDSLRSRQMFDGSGALIESVVTMMDAGGDPRVTQTVLTKGEGAPVGAGSSVTTLATVDLSGNVIDSVDPSGLRTQTDYDSLGRPASVTMTPPTSSGAAPLVFAYSYRSRDGQLERVSVNGADATRLSYDSATGQVSAFSYAGGAVTSSLGRFGNGAVNRVSVVTGSTRFTSSADFTTAGRIIGHTTTATGEISFTETRAYRFDDATRLASATITSNQTSDVVTTQFGYDFDAQASQCGSAYPGAGKDGLRTGGSRNGTTYTTCYNAVGRPVSTTDPLVTGGQGTAVFEHDARGRVVSISDVARPVSLVWDAGGQVAIMREGIDTTSPITTRLETYAGAVLRKSVTTTSGTSRLLYAGPWNLTEDDSGAISGVESLQYSLPGGAIVTVPSGGTAVLQVPGVDGSALAHIPVPTLGSGGVAPAIAAADRFGPFGEPLAVRDLDPQSARPTYGWKGSFGVETLAGSSAVALMGARAYAPALGQFLSPDPLLDSGNNVYSYTSGDPINASDLPGTEESNDTYILAGAAVAAVLSGLLLFRSTGATSVLGSLLGLGAAAAGAYVAVKSFSNDNTLMGSLAAAVAVAGTVTMGFNIYKGVGHFKKWRASAATQKVEAQKQTANVTPSAEDLFEAERLRMQQTQVQTTLSDQASLPDWASRLPPVERSPMATKMVSAVQDASRNLPAEGTAWSHVRGTQEVLEISETVFQTLQAQGKVEGRYNRFLIVLYSM